MMAQTGTRKQQGELTSGQGDRRRSEGFQPCFHADYGVFIQAPEPGGTRNDEPWEEMEPGADQEVRTSELEGPQEEICLSVQLGPQTQSRAGKTQHLGEDAGISGVSWRV